MTTFTASNLSSAIDHFSTCPEGTTCFQVLLPDHLPDSAINATDAERQVRKVVESKGCDGYEGVSADCTTQEAVEAYSATGSNEASTCREAFQERVKASIRFREDSVSGSLDQSGNAQNSPATDDARDYHYVHSHYRSTAPKVTEESLRFLAKGVEL